MKRALFIDRDGTLILEPQGNCQVDSLEKLEFYPKVIRNLYRIRKNLDFEFVMVTNQDGLGTDSFPEKTFLPAHRMMLKTFEGEGIVFDDVLIDPSFPKDNSPNRKPATGMLGKYLTGDYDLANSYVIGDRDSDVQLAMNLGCRSIWISNPKNDYLGRFHRPLSLVSEDWDKIGDHIFRMENHAVVKRNTKETVITVSIALNGSGHADIDTGLGMFDHLLEQLAKHSGMDVVVSTMGDLYVDEHHTIEDTALALGEAFDRALGSKRGIERYGFSLPMDDCLCSVAIDLGGRPCLVWDAKFNRENVGEMPTEMFVHFFKSFCDAARINLNIKAEGENEHHKIEGIFKAFARSIKMAIRHDPFLSSLPSTKGAL